MKCLFSWRCDVGIKSRLAWHAALAVCSLAPLLSTTSLCGAESTSPQQVVRAVVHANLYGLTGEQDSLLIATTRQPNSPLLQAYQGKLRVGKDWLSLDEAAKQYTPDAALETYIARRAAMTDDFDGNVTLADWCMSQKLVPQAQAHLLRALDFQPDNATIRSRLGHQRLGDRWLSSLEVEEQRQASQQQVEANKKWLPLITKIRDRLGNGSSASRSQALRDLKKLRDPLLIPALEAAFADASDTHLLALLDTLDAMTDPRASQSIARVAVFGDSPAVREKAAAMLGRRDRQSWIPDLLAAMRGTLKSEIQVFVQADGRLLYRHAFSREAQERNEVVVLDSAVIRVARPGGDARETLDTAVSQARITALQRERLAQRQNFNTQQMNDRIAWVLRTATGETKVASTPDDWWKWWDQSNEAFNQGPKQQSVSYDLQQTQIADQTPLSVQLSNGSTRTSGGSQPQVRHECFVAGTPVWTVRGEESIEKLRVGDMVLAQNVATGALEYKPVARTTRREITKLVRLTAGNDVLECTGGHLFWVLEEGWVKARDLKPGAMVHRVGGAVMVAANEAGPDEVTYNLVVADHHNYFVGSERCLTHDNTSHRATTVIAPGIANDE